MVYLCFFFGLIAFDTFTGNAHGQGQSLQQFTHPNGSVFKMPLKRKTSRKSKLTLQVDTRWANNYGYRPVEFVFASSQPTTTSHTIKIRLHGGWWTTRTGTMTVEEDIELPTGSTSLQSLVLLPQYRLAVQCFWWDVWIDGIKDDDLSLDHTTAMTMVGGVSQMNSDGLTILAAGPKSRRRQLIAPPTLDFQVLMLPKEEFPTRWRGYSSFDLVALTTTQFEQIANQSPQSLMALRRWVEAGGQLWIGEVGDEWEQLADVGKNLGSDGAVALDVTDMNDSSDESSEDADTPAETGWEVRRFRRRRDAQDYGGMSSTFLNLITNERLVSQDPTQIAQLRQDPDYISVSVTPSAPERTEAESPPQASESGESDDTTGARRRFGSRPRDSKEWFLDHPLGLGTVRAFRGPWDPVEIPELISVHDENGQLVSPMDAMPLSMRMAFRTALNWTERHGLAPDQANPDFANLLIPGLGLAPVTEFRVLITLFVLLIGPVNYWVLKRLGRLHLLVLTVPLAALLLTATLFIYAALSDGFGTSVRARSFTSLDQRSGNATCWARLSYYSGLAPAGGLTFPKDTAIYPIVPGWRDVRFDPDLGVSRESIWEPQQDRLTRGWLASRTPTQYLTVRSRKSPRRIDFAQSGERLRATNELGTAIRYLAVIDGEGRLFAGENIAPEERLFLAPTKRTEAIRNLRQLIMTNQPEAPPALSGGSDFALLGVSSRARYMGGGGYGGYSDDRLTGSLLENQIGDLGGMNGEAPLQIGTNAYVAITETGPEVSLGMDDVEEEASFHVIVGKW